MLTSSHIRDDGNKATGSRSWLIFPQERCRHKMRLPSVLLLVTLQILSQAYVSLQQLDTFEEDRARQPGLGATVGPAPPPTIEPVFTTGPVLPTRPPITDLPIGRLPSEVPDLTDETPTATTESPVVTVDPSNRPAPPTITAPLGSNSGNEFYIAFMDNYIKPIFRSRNHLILNRSRIFITTAETPSALAMIESEQGTSMVSVRSGEVVTRTFKNFKVENGTDRTKGIKIKAEQLKQISVFGSNEELHSTDAFTALPCSHLPTVTSYEYFAVSVPTATSADSAFLIVACSDNTTVSITPTQNIFHPYIPNFLIRAGTAFNVQLRERQTLYVQGRVDLTGTKVVSNNPISFFTGHECAQVPYNTSECDHLVEQIPPTATWGNQFLVAPTATRLSRDTIRIVASQDRTGGNMVCLYTNSGGDGAIFRVSLARAGNFMEVNITSRMFCFVNTTRPVMVVQFTAGGGADRTNADPFMVIVPAFRQYLDVTTFSTINGRDYQHYINIFVPPGYDLSGVVIDSVPMSTFANDWVHVPCPDSRGPCGYAQRVRIPEGVHSVWNSEGGPVGVTVYGLTYLESYAFVGGLKLTVPGHDSVPQPRTTFALEGTSVCLPCHPGNQERLSATWTKAGEIISFSDSDSGRFRLGSTGVLCIDDVRQSDAGEYVCHVVDQGLQYSTSLEVTDGIVVEPTCDVPDLDGPAIGVGQDTVYLDSSTRTFAICCRVEGPAGYRTTWKQNGEIINDNPDYRHGRGFIIFVGTIRNGCTKYTCQVGFKAQGASRNESTVICIGELAPPTVVKITGETSVMEKDYANYQCISDGHPEPTRMWTVDTETESALPPTARDDGDGQLTVRVTSSDSSRRYCCDVSNQLGEILSKCIMIDVLIAPVIAKAPEGPFLTYPIPPGVTLPMDKPLNATAVIGANVMIAEGYQLSIICPIIRGNPKPSIVWYLGDSIIQGTQYLVEENGTLVIDSVMRDRDEGVYTCIANTPDVGQDEASTTVIVPVQPKINNTERVISPGNCLDLTESLINTQPVGVDLCLRAGVGASITLQCNILEGSPAPSIEWLKNGVPLAVHSTTNKHLNDTIKFAVPVYAYGRSKTDFEGNYTCRAFNVAGQSTMETHITIYGDLPVASVVPDFRTRYLDIYNQLRKSVTEHFPGVVDGTQHLSFLTTGRLLNYEDYDPGYLYDESEESILPRTMENMFDLVDIIPDGSSIVFNPYRAPRLHETYSQLVELLHNAPSSLTLEERIRTRAFLQEGIRDPGSGQVLPRLSLYLLYKNTYYMTKMEADDLVDTQREKLPGWDFTEWHERNIHSLQMKIDDAYTKWEMYADKREVEEQLKLFGLDDHAQEVNNVKAQMLANHRMSRFKDEKEYYLVKLYPNYWYKDLKNQVMESFVQMQFQLTQLKAEVEILELTRAYLEKETHERETLNVLFPSLDPVYQLYRDLDMATLRLQELVKESEDMRYDCLISGNPADCHLYWGLQDHIREQVLKNYTEFYWYVHTIEAALDHRQFSIPAISSTINKLKVRINHLQTAVSSALSHTSGGRDNEEIVDHREFFTDFMYSLFRLPTNYDFSLPSSLTGRLLWYINPESTRLVPSDLAEEYNITINHLNTALTNMSAKLSRVNVHRRWFRAGIFGDKNLELADPAISVSPGEIFPPQRFREIIENGTYQLPLYPSSLLLATDVELTVDIPFIFHTLPTLIKLSYDPYVSGGFGPFSFGPLHRGSAGNMKFRVGVRENKISITLPGTQVIGYVNDVVPKHPREIGRKRRSIDSMARDGSPLTESDFDQWLFSKKTKDGYVPSGLFHKDHDHRNELGDDLTSSETGQATLSMFITPTAPLHTATVYYNSTL